MNGRNAYERRTHSRVVYKGRAAYFSAERSRHSGAKIMNAPVVDISETGALLVLKHDSEEGEIITLSFNLGGHISSAICCQVVDVRRTEDGFLTGVEFIIVKDSDSRALKSLINESF